ncbi:MAG TPA: TIGR03747 family integrating conjugative element membrane protein [Gammaproteobacteria bacterium]|nr:TIGR03747 family integrating conjugative element membrane protein [Gammaproteobacteria bacterium]
MSASLDTTPQEKSREAARTRRRGFLYPAIYAVGILLGSLVFSILAEWAGLTFLWSAQGVHHSETMLATEIGYLDRDFRRRLLHSSPAELAQRVSRRVQDTLLIKTGFSDARRRWLLPVSPTESTAWSLFKRAYRVLDTYFLAAANIAGVFSVRLLVIALSLPMFALIGIAALVDGLVQRDLRRFGGGREYGRLFHTVRRYNSPLIMLTAFVYLSIPVSLHPNWLFVPAALLFGLTLFITAATFTKYF